MNHHQLDFCNAISSEVGKNNFSFIEYENMGLEFIKFGYPNYKSKLDYLIDYQPQRERAFYLSKNADVIIIGSIPPFLRSRIVKDNKKAVIYFFSERPLKGRISFFKRIKFFIKSFFVHFPNYFRKFYLLSVGPYSYKDYSSNFSYIGKSFKWGYFPVFKEYNVSKKSSFFKSSKFLKILWVGRLIPYKNPYIVFQLANFLRSLGVNFKIKIVGDGPLKGELNSMIVDNFLTDFVSIIGPLKSNQIRKIMFDSDIFIFSSNQEEGWGAVLNEAMNSACVVIASIHAGSSLYLINHTKNGYLFDPDKKDDLIKTIQYVLKSKNNLSVMNNAYLTIKKTWNGVNAAKRLLNLSNQILHNKRIVYFKNGPLSKI